MTKEINLDEAANLYLGSVHNLTFEEYRSKKRQAKSVIHRAIFSGQIKKNDGKIDLSSFLEWKDTKKIQVGLYIRVDIWEKFKEFNLGRNLSYEVEKLMAKSME